jgi:hypothetical protein
MERHQVGKGGAKLELEHREGIALILEVVYIHPLIIIMAAVILVFTAGLVPVVGKGKRGTIIEATVLPGGRLANSGLGLGKSQTNHNQNNNRDQPIFHNTHLKKSGSNIVKHTMVPFCKHIFLSSFFLLYFLFLIFSTELNLQSWD